MKKRIRLHQISAGMFVQELELAENEPSGMAGGFYISSPADVDRIMRSHALSVVIDTERGRDIGAGLIADNSWDVERYDAYLKCKREFRCAF
ncbi:DUF3391 domain-containing protein [Rhizobium sp. P28RR-XV]|uniref:DUF3391 domain-containing protein n=1 Tax=Rhizobium sp. P28RR-XV TaxID=2726737 RepID=UPI0014576DCE|nr:DUF3391 domain-containing protein [Rhizobium sp. P28RR-XV]NLR89379.1 DUF3391 domain-containing protein [Rhizobium sp. P28RR-XV]